MLTEVNGYIWILQEMANELERRFKAEDKEMFGGSWQLYSTQIFRFFEQYPTGIDA